MVLAPGCPGDKVALHSLEWLADLAVRRIGEACCRRLPLNAALLFLLVIRRGRYYVSTMAGPWCSDHEPLRALHLLLRPRLYNACTYTWVRGCDCLILLVCTYGLWRQTPGPHLVTGVHEPAAVIPPRGPVTTLRPYVVRAAAGSSNSPPIRLGHDVSPGLPALVSIPFHHFYSRMLARFWGRP